MSANSNRKSKIFSKRKIISQNGPLASPFPWRCYIYVTDDKLLFMSLRLDFHISNNYKIWRPYTKIRQGCGRKSSIS